MSAATPDRLDCAYCPYVGPPPADVQANLRAAAAVLGQMQARRRQLSRFQQRTVGQMGCSMTLYFLLLAAMALPFALSAVACTAMRDEVDTWVLVVLGFGPLLVVLASGAFGFWWMRRSRQNLELACAAQPPAVKGRPACCHVCGGELTAAPERAVARCPFCGTDNVVSESAMQRRWSEQQLVLGGYEQAVRQRASTATSTSRSAKLLVFLAAVGAPIIAVGVAVVIAFGLVLHEKPPDESQTYVAVSTPEGECLALLKHYPGGVDAYDFGSAVPDGAANRQRLKAGAFKPITAKGLVGLSVLGDDGLTRKVSRVYTTSLDETDNRVALGVLSDDNYQTRSVVGLCLAGDKPLRRVAHFRGLGNALLVTRVRETLVFGLSDGLYRVQGNDDVKQLWRTRGGEHALSMASDGDAIYVELPRALVRVALDGTATTLSSMPRHLGAGLALDGRTLYFADGKGVSSVAASGGAPESTIQGAVPRALCASEGALALIETDGQVLARAAGASTPSTIGTHAAPKHGIVIARAQAWWVQDDDELVSSPLGGGTTAHHGKLDYPAGPFAIRGDDVWWMKRGNGGALLSRPVAGGPSTNLAPGAKSVDRFAFDGDAVYWIDIRRRWIVRRPL